jgi:pimeloyl-ACP methyl ester carboxylesterase
MALAVRTRLGQGYSTAAPAEWQYVSGAVGSWRGKPPLIYCHGSGDTAQTVIAKTGQRALINALAQRYLVIAPDLGLQAFGNATAVARIGEAIAYAASLGSTGKAVLVGGSMGVQGAFNYARLYPQNVAAIAGIIPATDLANSHAVATADVNAAYPPAYDDATMGPTWNPVQFAGSLSAEIPIHLFTASNDAIAWPSTATAFVTARPLTGRTDIGALGHTEAAVTASINPVVAWLGSVANRSSA